MKMKRYLVVTLVVISLMVGGNMALAGGRPLSATLTGAAEVPGPGDPDGSGTAHLTLNQGQGEICFTIEVADIASPPPPTYMLPQPIKPDPSW